MASMNRRSFVAAGTLVVAAALAPRISFAQAQTPAPAAGGPFTLPPLGYAPNSLEPHIDTMTMEIHHGRHHNAFITNLNNLAKDNPQIAQTPPHQILGKLTEVPEAIRTAVRNNMGGHANHTMFWQIMGANGGAPSGELAAAIDRDLGGLNKLKTDFNAAGLRVFGSGWVFVTVTRDGKLAIETRPNQDNPLMDGRMVLMGNDVWEHAYYLKYQNRRADYLANWWNVVNWAKVGERFAAAKAGTLTV